MFPFNDLFEDASGIDDLLRQLTPGQQAAFALSVIAEVEASGTASPEEIERLRSLALRAGDSDPADFAAAQEYLKEASAANEPWLVGTAVQLTLFAPAEKPAPAPLRSENAELAEAFALFDERVRRVDHEGQVWYSIVDVVAVLTDSDRPRKYWDDLKRKLIAEGWEVSENIGQLKLRAEDGKLRLTDVGTRETIFRLVQSIPSPRAEPIKLWMAELGEGRARTLEQQTARRQQRVDAVARRLGHGEAWAQERIAGIEPHKGLIGVAYDRTREPGQWFGKHLNDAVYKGWKRTTARQIRDMLGLGPRQNVRDHLSPVALSMLRTVELAAYEILSATPEDARLTPSETVQIVIEAGRAMQISTEALERMLGIDLLTGEPLPPRLME